MNDAVLVTGCNGGIGRSTVAAFADAGWFTIGVDRTKRGKELNAAHFIQSDIGALCADDVMLEKFSRDVVAALNGRPLKALINNAAVQTVASVESLTSEAFIDSLTVNVTAPFVLVKAFLSNLEAAEGAVINIGSVHAQASKPGFAAYATSKAALHGLTRSLALDLGPRKIRVNTLAPAATATSMLKAGFEGNAEGFKALKGVHPLGRIAEPEEVAKLALFLASEEASFLTGATLYADGGILSRLHDPA